MDDLISRQAAIEAFWGLSISIRPSAFEAITDMLKTLPSAQPERCEDCKTFSKTRLLIPQPEPSQIARDIATIIEHEKDMRVIARNEIIRCKDCKHWREGTTYSYCDKLFGMGVLDIYDYMTTEDDFCSRAERRTDEPDKQTD